MNQNWNLYLKDLSYIQMLYMYTCFLNEYNRRSESNKHFSIKLKPKANLGYVEFAIMESDHGQKLYYQLINLLYFKEHYYIIILETVNINIYVSA